MPRGHDDFLCGHSGAGVRHGAVGQAAEAAVHRAAGGGWVSGGFLIYELSAVIDGDVSIVSDTEREEIHSLALRRDGMDMLKGVEQGLRAAAEVEIFTSQL